MFKIESEKPLSPDHKEQYSGLAYDGCFLYFTTKGKKCVEKRELCSHDKQEIETCRIYDKLCYDSVDRCFWASVVGEKATIYQLNEGLKEIDSVSLLKQEGCGDRITGIAYQCSQDVLMIAFPSGIVCFDKCHHVETVLKSKKECEQFLGIATLCPYFLCDCAKEEKRSVQLYACCGKLIKEVEVPWEFDIEAAVFIPCKGNCYNYHFYVLISKKNGESHLCDYLMECEELSESICDCNFTICNRECGRKKPCKHKNGCYDVMESVALVEASIAHILNAEGEKLQKVIALSKDIEEILEVNRSVNRTIDKVTCLEQLLCMKLQALRDCEDFCEEECEEPCEEFCEQGCGPVCEQDCADLCEVIYTDIQEDVCVHKSGKKGPKKKKKKEKSCKEIPSWQSNYGIL